MIETRHASYQDHRNLNLKRRPVTAATGAEKNEMEKARDWLNKAKNATDEQSLIHAVTEAFRITRNICRQRIL